MSSIRASWKTCLRRSLIVAVFLASPAASAAVVAPSGPVVQGVDVAQYQGTIDWSRASLSIGFAIARAGDGTNYADPTFARNWAGIASAGLIRGAYWTLEPGATTASAVLQADLLLQAMGPWSPGELPPILDIETAGAQSPTAFRAYVVAAVNELEATTGRRPLIFTGGPLWNREGSPVVDADLWIAQTGVAAPNLPNAWSQWSLWQYSSGGAVDGINGNVNRDEFNGSVAQLDALAGLTVPEPETASLMSLSLLIAATVRRRRTLGSPSSPTASRRSASPA